MKTSAMNSQQELPVIRAWYELTVWLMPKIAKFPRDTLFVLGERIERQSIGILETLIRARYVRERSGQLDSVN